MRQIKSTRGGERVELQGGRILRSTGRKDRHSKICTAKGPRDRRLRLSAHTAIQFYDVQDRLGCNRPSEAIDWLMKEAKSAIDALNSADQNPEKEERGKTEYIPYSGCGNGNQSQQHLNEEEPINGFSFFVPSSGFQIHPNNEGNPTEFHHHLSLISSCESPTMNWSNPPTGEIGQSQKMIAWNSNSIGQDQFFSQGGTLQSSYLPSFLALMNSPLPNVNFDQIPEVGLSSVSGNCFAGDGFSGDFVFPGVRGEGEKQNPCPNKPSSTPCVLHYHD